MQKKIKLKPFLQCVILNWNTNQLVQYITFNLDFIHYLFQISKKIMAFYFGINVDYGFHMCKCH